MPVHARLSVVSLTVPVRVCVLGLLCPDAIPKHNSSVAASTRRQGKGDSTNMTLTCGLSRVSDFCGERSALKVEGL
jgi:hypothetical protein